MSRVLPVHTRLEQCAHLSCILVCFYPCTPACSRSLPPSAYYVLSSVGRILLCILCIIPLCFIGVWQAVHTNADGQQAITRKHQYNSLIFIYIRSISQIRVFRLVFASHLCVRMYLNLLVLQLFSIIFINVLTNFLLVILSFC